MQQTNWQPLLRQAKNNLRSFIKELDLEESSLQLSEKAIQSFPFRVPDGFLERITKGDPNDPLLRQVLPVTDEEIHHPSFSKNPLDEDSSQPVPGLLHKYHGRALLVTTGACAIHCRYCFRRHFPYSEANPSTKKWQRALAHITADNTISEIILSGGDPLTLSDENLSTLVNLLSEVPHIKRLRIHSRIPVILPQRMSKNLISLLATTRLKTVMVVHVNHPNELNAETPVITQKLNKAGITVFNQSVLLKGVNDNAEVLRQLSEALFDSGIMPYYLHMLDPVAGAVHFEVSEARARQIMQELFNTLPGYLIPRLVREIPGKESKIPVDLKITQESNL